MPIHPQWSYTGEYKIRTYEIDRYKRVTVPALIQLMQEAAMQNVINIQLSVWDLEPHNISWVLMRKDLKINNLPKLGEQISIVTHPAGFEKFFTYRDFKVYNEQKELIATAATTWLLMDTKARRMTRIPEFIKSFEVPAQEFLPHAGGKLPKFEQVDIQKNFTVGWHDLDFNEHLNNNIYLQWMLETVPDEVLLNCTLKRLEVQYRKEARWQDKIICETQRLGNNRFLHQLLKKEDRKELASAVTEWNVDKAAL